MNSMVTTAVLGLITAVPVACVVVWLVRARRDDRRDDRP